MRSRRSSERNRDFWLENTRRLRSRPGELNDQGVLVETADGSRTLAEHNADVAFNPASVMKLATSLVALSQLGPDYRYRTVFLADGKLDSHSRTLEGDLVIEGAADPMFAMPTRKRSPPS